MEKWTDINIPEFIGLYKISSYGNIYSNHSNKILKPCKDSRGYLQVNLMNHPFKKCIKMHMLVWDHFGDGVRNGRLINIDHIDENKENNNIDNLQLLASRDNKIKSLSKNGKLAGVYFKSGWKWVSEIIVNHKRIYLGGFDTEIEGHNAYLNARKKYGV